MNFWILVGALTTVLIITVMVIREMVDYEGVIDSLADLLIASTPGLMRAMLCFVAAVCIVSVAQVMFL